jgi:hypothetical protein
MQKTWTGAATSIWQYKQVCPRCCTSLQVCKKNGPGAGSDRQIGPGFVERKMETAGIMAPWPRRCQGSLLKILEALAGADYSYDKYHVSEIEIGHACDEAA